MRGGWHPWVPFARRWVGAPPDGVAVAEFVPSGESETVSSGVASFSVSGSGEANVDGQVIGSGEASFQIVAEGVWAVHKPSFWRPIPIVRRRGRVVRSGNVTFEIIGSGTYSLRPTDAELAEALRDEEDSLAAVLMLV